MKFRSTRGASPPATFREALFSGLAPDGGLYVPEEIPRLAPEVLERFRSSTLVEAGTAVLRGFIEEIPESDLRRLLESAWDFPVPIEPIEPGIATLQLFHGPTLAFKDFGVRFMARVLSWFLEPDSREVTILVATSGDTGSAVAHGFHNVPHTRVVILYPSGRVSRLQESQMATLGGNIHALEVEGSFDDCQRLVKEALASGELRLKLNLTTANSINIARLLPQIAYYAYAVAHHAPVPDPGRPPLCVVVPSGNFGNVTAAVYARAMGVPIGELAAATNANDVVPEFLARGVFRARASVETLSNAMDVGNPGNLARLQALYGPEARDLATHLTALSVSDEETLEEIRATFASSGHILDPHTAVGVAAARRLRSRQAPPRPVLVPATAHPAKFPDVIRKALGIEIPLPPALSEALDRPKLSVPLAAQSDAFFPWLERIAP